MRTGYDIPKAAGPRRQLVELFRAIKVNPDEHITVNHDHDGMFTTTFGPARTAGERAAPFAGRANVWHSVNVVRDGIPVGRRGTANDVVRVTAVFTDLDVASGKRCLPDWAAAREVLRGVDIALGVGVPVWVLSGSGLHPYVPIADGADVEAATVMLKRFGLLVAGLAQLLGGDVDNVHEPARVLRTPGTFNMKGDTPVPVKLAVRAHIEPLTLSYLDGVLPELPPPPRVETQPDDGSARHRLRGLVSFVLEAQKGERNNRLYWAACRGRDMAGDIPAATIAGAIAQAGVRVGLPAHQVRGTVASGMGTPRSEVPL